MRKYLLIFVSLVFAAETNAQQFSDGFYRAKNQTTGRYITVVDDHGSVDYQANSADLNAIKTYKFIADKQWNAQKVISNPGSVVYAEYNAANKGYKLFAQGCDTYSIVSGYLKVETYKHNGQPAYQLYASKSGVSKYLKDFPNADRDSSYVGADSFDKDYSHWDILPLETEGENYFGMFPTITHDDSYYLSFFASFPFSFHSTGMHAYYINKVDTKYKVAVIQEIGQNKSDIPAAMPLIVKCSSAEPANNRIDIHTSNAKLPEDNLLNGVYFLNWQRQKTNPHYNVTPNDTSIMRVLAILSDGSLGMKKSTDEFMPKNSAHLYVEPGTPDELKLVTQEEYERMIKPKETLLGDANEDGTVDVADITTIASYILGMNPSPFNMANADVNKDGVIDVADITLTAAKILGPNILRGDANNDGIVDVADITAIASAILGTTPTNWNATNADANADNIIDVADITKTAAIILGQDKK